jgi:hypothetical protein
MEWKIKQKEFSSVFPGFELNDDHTLIEHNEKVILVTNRSVYAIYKKSSDIPLNLSETFGTNNWKLFISFEELRPLLTEFDGYKSIKHNNDLLKNSGADARVQRANGRH